MESLVKFLFCVVTIAGSGFVYGFHTGFLNILSATLMQWYDDVSDERLDTKQIKEPLNLGAIHAWVTISFSIGGVIGAALIWPFATYLGRKLSLFCSNLIVVFALIIVSFVSPSSTFELLIFGRVLLGVSAGINSGIGPMYLVEISPHCLRGFAGSCYYLIVALSIFMAYVFTHPTIMGEIETWSYVFVVSGCPIIIQSIMLIFCPESPKYLMFDKGDEDRAEDAVADIEGEEIDEEMDDLREEMALLDEIGPVTIERLFKDETLRNPLIISAVVMLGQQMTGVTCLLYFSCVIFEHLGFDDFKANAMALGLAFVNWFCALVCVFAVDKVGRKPLLLASYFGMVLTVFCFTLTMILMSISVRPNQAIDTIAVVLIYLYVMFFALGAGTIGWFFTAEISNHFARPITVSMTVMLYWIVQLIFVGCFLPFWFMIHTYTFLFYIIFDIATVAFLLLTLRETAMVPSVDITEMFYD
ncbi:solute carrier family 2, facilitated glucose transporter member 3-like isoform X1 [Tribolium castaneum]|uniref:solute carrier family 2, facilitated glucose transporter member 3-like isoform X1 n=1 Tax=Tribolium castaneum TaxID=7070 RepID=UPI0001758275|nr:PREDICTED: solute carrier family 2, facilitated glucose transporter member 1-like isoform X1 [Tribolium castaneum]|eukprot:XP_001815237.1 PREDICTED: solute carrier family 2, facilitated glucose transporter member 1-like isoform X1 [Tribolium castaneum]